MINKIKKVILFILFLMANKATLPYQNFNILSTKKICFLSALCFISFFFLTFVLLGKKNKNTYSFIPQLENILKRLDRIISYQDRSNFNSEEKKQKIDEIIKKIYPSLDKIEADDFPILLCLTHIFIQNHLECTEFRHLESCKDSNEFSLLHKLYPYNFFNNSIEYFFVYESLLSTYIQKAIYQAITPKCFVAINPSKSLLLDINQEEEDALDDPKSEYSKKIEIFIESKLKEKDDNKIYFLDLLSKQAKHVSEAAISNSKINHFQRFDTEETLLKNLLRKIDHIENIFHPDRRVIRKKLILME